MSNEIQEIIKYIDHQIKIFSKSDVYDKKYSIKVFNSIKGRLKALKYKG